MTAHRLQRAVDVLATVGALLVVPVIAIEVRAPAGRWLAFAAAANWAIWSAFLADALVNAYSDAGSMQPWPVFALHLACRTNPRSSGPTSRQETERDCLL